MAILSRNTTQFGSFFEDKWTINDRLTLEYGLRLDRDNIAHENNVSPRLAFAFTPIRDGRTVVTWRSRVVLRPDQFEHCYVSTAARSTDHRVRIKWPAI